MWVTSKKNYTRLDSTRERDQTQLQIQQEQLGIYSQGQDGGVSGWEVTKKDLVRCHGWRILAQMAWRDSCQPRISRPKVRPHPEDDSGRSDYRLVRFVGGKGGPRFCLLCRV